MDAIEALVAQVHGLSGNGDLGHLLGLLRHNDESLRGANLHHALQNLDPSRHSLGYLFFLDARWSSAASVSAQEAETMLLTISNFIRTCIPEQIRMAPEKFNSVCRKLKELSLHLHKPKTAILPLLTAVRKLRPSPEHLTSIHSDFLLVCLLAKNYKAALSILEDDIFEIEQKKTGLTPKDFLLYSYYGGMVYVGVKNFAKALVFFQHTFTAPATVMNAIAIEAYKKYLLVCLIHNGQVSPFAKYTPSIVQRNMKQWTQDYIELVNAYMNRKVGDVKRCVAAHEEVFKNDKNLGLAKQVISSLYKRNIQRLTQTYLTLSLQDIADTVQLDSPKDAELRVLQMIQDGEIFATINQKDGMVSFQEDPEQYKTRQISHSLHSEIQQIIRLATKLTAVDEQVSCDHAYLSKVGNGVGSIRRTANLSRKRAMGTCHENVEDDDDVDDDVSP